MQYVALSPGRIYAGCDAIVALVTFDQGSSYVNVTGLSVPAGFGLEAIYYKGQDIGKSEGAGTPYFRVDGTPFCNANAANPIWLRVSAPANAAPGQIAVTATLTVDGEAPQALVVSLDVFPPPVMPVPIARPKQAIPGLDAYMAKLQEWAPKFNDAAAQYGFGVESEIWYYDGARVLWGAGALLQTSEFDGAALNIARQYRDYVVSCDGQIPGWRVFARGLRMAYERTKEVSYLDALLRLRKAPYVAVGGDADACLIRETAYALEVFVELETAGQPRDPRMVRAANFLMSHIDQLCRQLRGQGTDNPVHQPFFDGLALEALIQYCELTGDARVVDTVKLALDFIWTYATNQQTGYVLYDAWKPSGDAFTGLNMLGLAPGYAWLFAKTGAALYRDRADFLFLHLFDDGQLWGGKQFSQCWRMAPEFLAWRTAPEFADPTTVTLSLAKPSGWAYDPASGILTTPAGEKLRFALTIS